MRSFCARADNGCSVVVDGEIVGSDPHGFGGCHAVAHYICSLRPNEANEVMRRARFVIQDLEKEGCDDFPDSFEVGVERLPGDRIELLKGMGEFCPDLLGSHCG